MNTVIGDFFKEAETGKYEVALTVHNCAGIPMPNIGTTMVGKWPNVMDTLRNIDTMHAHDLMGRCVSIPTDTPGGKIKVACVYAMVLPGRPCDRRFDYDAFVTSVRELDSSLKDDTSIVLPRIGVGAQGGRWGKVKSILVRELSRHRLTVVTRQ